jgi:tetratricopeptide (TPR) repeat protein
LYLLTGQTDRARSSFEQARALPDKKGDPLSWRIAGASLLDQLRDRRAAAEWKGLGEEHPDDPKIQWAVLRSNAVQSDPGQHQLVGHTIENLRKLVGDEGVTLKIARARWLLEENAGEQPVVDASVLLGEVLRAAPDLIEPHRLQATAFARLKNYSGAVEQLKLASTLEPLVAPPDRPAAESVAIALDLARLLTQQKRYSDARAYLDALAQQRDYLSRSDRLDVAALLSEQADPNAALALLDSSSQQAAPTLLQAILLRQLGKNDQAEAIYRKLLEHPDASVIESAIGFYQSLNRGQEAAKLLDLLDKTSSAPGEGELVHANYYRRLGDAPKALENYVSATRKAPENVSAWRQRIGYLLGLGRGQAAVDAAKEALTHIPGNKQFDSIVDNAANVTVLSEDSLTQPILIAMLGAGDDMLPDMILATHTIGDARRANLRLNDFVPTVRQIADRQIAVLPLQLYLIACYVQMASQPGANADALAEEIYTVGERAMRMAPGISEPARMTAVALTKLSDPSPSRADPKRWSDIESFARKWRQLSPDQAMAADTLIARSLIARAQYQAVLELLRPYVDKASGDPKNSDELTALAAYCSANLKVAPPEQTARVLEPFLKRSELHRAIWMSLALSLSEPAKAAQWLRQVAPLTAVDSFSEAIELASAWLRLSAATPEFTPEARAAFRHASGLAKDAFSLITVGVLAEKYQMLDEAEISYRKALALDPNNLTAGNNLAMVIDHRHGDLAEAERLVSNAIANHPNDRYLANCYDTLASIQAGRQRLHEAIDSMDAALKQQPDSLVFQVHIASIYLAAKQFDKARLWLNKADAHADQTVLDPQDAEQLKSLHAAVERGA